jgi:hypothetical protein
VLGNAEGQHGATWWLGFWSRHCANAFTLCGYRYLNIGRAPRLIQSGTQALWKPSHSSIAPCLVYNTWHVGFEVLTAAVMKNNIFWNITLCCPLEVYCLHLQGRISRFATCFHSDFMLGLFFGPEYGGDVPSKRPLTSNGVDGVISQQAGIL